MSADRHVTYFGITTRAELDVLEQLAAQLGLSISKVFGASGMRVLVRFPDLVLKGYVEDQVYAIRAHIKSAKASLAAAKVGAHE